MFREMALNARYVSNRDKVDIQKMTIICLDSSSVLWLI